MPLTKDEFEKIKSELGDLAIAQRNTFQEWDENRIKHVSILEVLDKYFYDKSKHLTVERVKGMIEKKIQWLSSVGNTSIPTTT